MVNQSKRTTSIKELRNLLIWVLLALIIRWQVVEPRWIPSGSMLPTLQIRDKILVDKLTYKFINKDNLSELKDKIIVFKAPDQLVDAGYEADTALIKRVIGIPGDKIEIKEGNLYVNDNIQGKYSFDSDINYSMGPLVIPNESLWVMGDNRNNSLDSHIWGVLPFKKVIGKAIFRYWPLVNFGPISSPEINNFN